VSVFYVLLGISLSLEPIQLARDRNRERFVDTMFSSIFRRALRLYLPVYFVQSCMLFASCLGMYNHAYASSQDWPFVGTNEVQQDVKITNAGQIQHWATELWHLAIPFRPIRPEYDVYLWTVQLEFRNSIIIFAILVGCAKLGPRTRMTLTAIFYTFCLVVNEGEVGLFIAGMGLAEFLLIRDEDAKKLSSTKRKPQKQSLCTKTIWAAVLLLGSHLLSWPAWRYQTLPGYIIIYNLTPSFIESPEWTWWHVGAAVSMLALCGSDQLRRPFQTPFAIYLGKMSFPLYIIHGPSNHILGTWLVQFFWGFTGNATSFTYELGVVVAFCTEAVAVVWLSDILTRTVDIPCAKLGRTLQHRWS
ncbi:hypothetical protein P153DRAFT_302702, partial [Dothidotthia symphoricarpi CBS 119687]